MTEPVFPDEEAIADDPVMPLMDKLLDVVLGTQKEMAKLQARVKELEHHVYTLESELAPELRRLTLVIQEWVTGRRRDN
jgi:hypothetical protein